MGNEKQENYSTRDIYLATTLTTLKFKMVGIDYQIEGERGMPVGYFMFERTPELIEAEQKFWRGEIAVEPRMFISNLRSIKAEINNIYKNPHSKFDSVKPKK